ncbi:MAG: DUF4159 domain-containing protein [Planctomycetes bacterium]|nr:DUF4159 domain-containing protein [Planctomycetota bacterium]
MRTIVRPTTLLCGLVCGGAALLQGAPPATPPATPRKPIVERAAVTVPDPAQTGGESQSIVQIASVTYAGNKTSKCFSDHFLAKAERDSAISTSRRFHGAKLATDELYAFPLIIMTGEGDFTLLDKERENLRRFVERGGMLLASAGCSSPDWDKAFRREMALIFPAERLRPLTMSHPIFHTVYDIASLQAKKGDPKPLEGISLSGRLGVIYSQDGLNDTQHSQGCCCCGGNEITNCVDVNVNILAYALMY